MAISKNNKIYSNLISKVFDEEVVRGMIISLSRKGGIESKREMVSINKLDKKTNIINKKFDSCVMLNIDESIDYLQKQLDSKKGMSFYEARTRWLKILKFTKKNIEKLQSVHEEPNEKKDLLEELIREKEKI
ncbi:hypothetical protein [Poseidonibacter ostreae]|uniref:Uncharacterized protein n=1 Tax=Poseidonibacter ostreae TaxID=2654171 RepID=A0A6L4WWM1_9BACT|nr:hypothetical protein [Poseidonibacter ostreae]KAB7891338.1 hypothetical protein GBG19_00445 [Poseidonibacter ostreae]